MQDFDKLSIIPERSQKIIIQFLKNLNKDKVNDCEIIFPSFYELTDIKNWEITSLNEMLGEIVFYTSPSFDLYRYLSLYIHLKLAEILKTISISQYFLDNQTDFPDIKKILLSSYEMEKPFCATKVKDKDILDVKINAELIRSFDKIIKNLINEPKLFSSNSIWTVEEFFDFVDKNVSTGKLNKITQDIAKILNNLVDIYEENEKKVAFTYLIHYMFLTKNRQLSFVFSSVSQGKGLGGVFVHSQKDMTESEYIVSITNTLALRLASNSLLKLLHKQTLKTALISILVDSYAHNISAHSLSALKWWFELRHKIADKRFFVKESQGLELSSFQPEKLVIQREKIQNTAEIYYAALGLTDSIYNSQFCSLFDILNFNINQGEINKLLLYEESNQNYNSMVTKKSRECIGKVSTEEITDNGIGKNGNINIDCFNPRFPVSLDYALFPFFRFLRDKGAFWSGVTRDNAYGGESKTWYQVLWEDFANNPLYLGTIAKSEGISKVNINLAIKKDESWTYGRFVTIDLSLLDYEERIATNPRLKIEYQKQDFVVLQDHLKIMDISTDIKDKERSNIDSETLLKLDAKLESIFLSVKNKEYTKYALIRLGKCFARFREIMSSEEYTIFLPGGVVGEHALFTIFENSLRNIKHYKNLDLS
nr:hypothetical protein [Bacteroidales bacterium]